MIEIDLTLPLSYDDADIRRAIFERLPTLCEQELISYRLYAVGVDTRQKPPCAVRARAVLSVEPERERGLLKMKKLVRSYDLRPLTVVGATEKSRRPVVVGMGPAGLFAALVLAKAGVAPIVLEQGPAVEERAERVRTFFSGGSLDPDANIQFGEGGAGAFSDGKLKYGHLDEKVLFVLESFVEAGAPESLLTLRAPHIGTDYLPVCVKNLRDKIISYGGEVRFGDRLVDIDFENGAVRALTVAHGGECYQIETDAVFLACGHSARPLFYMLEEKGVAMSARPFGMGVRIEHPQKSINEQIYGKLPEGLFLPPASYHLVTHLKNGRSVYSFCMCPGGEVVAAASERGGIVTNGMSPYLRDGENANAALLVSLRPDDFSGDRPTRGLRFQEEVERRAFALGGNYRAPATTLGAFMKGRCPSLDTPLHPTYARGTTACDLEELFPSFITDSLRMAIADFEEYQPGFFDPNAILTAPETRSTSPIRIERDAQTYESLTHRGLYPVGEGSGYSGGILSSATDAIGAALAFLSSL